MDAIEFVKDYGFEYSKAVIDSAPTSANYVEWYPLRSRFYVTDFGCNHAVLLNNLKQIVEAFELVNSIGGLDFAKNFIKVTGSTKDNMLEKAIELVEKVNV